MPEHKETNAAKEAGKGGYIKKALGNRNVLLGIAVLVAIILIVTIPSRFGEKGAKEPFNRNLEKLNICKDVKSLAEKNSCYRDLAFETNKTYFCTKVFNSSSISESCVAFLAIKANSKTACYELLDLKTRSYCIAELAIKKVELPLCDNVEDRDWRTYCYSQMALAMKKPEPCARIETDTAKADCYVALAKKINSGPTCAYILEQGRRDDCFLSIGTTTSDKLLCAEISEPATRWTCYHRVAVATGDASLCKKIPENLNQNCYNAINRSLNASKT